MKGSGGRRDSIPVNCQCSHLICKVVFSILHPSTHSLENEVRGGGVYMEPDDLRGRFPMHALATAKAGSLGDERYISHSIWI